MNRFVKIIAEAGVNHDGDIEKAFKLIDIAKNAGADYVKFQTFKSDDLTDNSVEQASYQKRNDESKSQLEMLKRLELSQDDFKIIIDYCNKKKIKFASTPFSPESLDFLVSMTDMDFIKIPSGEITNFQLIKAVAEKNIPIILSTGMSTMLEISMALNLIMLIWEHQSESQLSLQKIIEFSPKDETFEKLKKNVTLLHCTSNYPCDPSEMNLNAIPLIRSAHGVKVGYSDHSLDFEASILSVGLGASIIEKHFTYDVNAIGPDHSASLSPEQLENFVKSVRKSEIMLGERKKIPSSEELLNRKVIRKKLILDKGKVHVKRASHGKSPIYFFDEGK